MVVPLNPARAHAARASFGCHLFHNGGALQTSGWQLVAESPRDPAEFPPEKRSLQLYIPTTQWRLGSGVVIHRWGVIPSFFYVGWVGGKRKFSVLCTGARWPSCRRAPRIFRCAVHRHSPLDLLAAGSRHALPPVSQYSTGHLVRHGLLHRCAGHEE